MIFIRYPFHSDIKYVHVNSDYVKSDLLEDFVTSNLDIYDFSLYHNGKKLDRGSDVSNGSTVYVSFSLPGGKGGFGSMLRAIGAQIEKTTNREACRDLSGRRLRDINEEQRLKKWLAKEAEREAEKLRRRKERLERLKSKPKHNFVDFEFEKEISELPERVDDAVAKGLQKATTNPAIKREASEPACSSKKKCVWLDEDISSESSSSEAESQEKDFSATNSEISNDKDYSNQSSVSESISREISEDSLELNTDKDEDEANNVGFTKTEFRQTVNEETALEKCNFETSNESSSIVQERNSFEISDESSLMNQSPNDNNVPEERKKETEEHCKRNSPSVENHPVVKEEDNSPIDLLSYQSVAELEALGLERLKTALIVRGLKCGGSISDRAQRLWKIRGLEPHEYPPNLLAKKKK
ncbi:replication stress response regulator SDE2-like [Stegodyphus dumicola]|uniref:replication stress response regulator SDE2-like n=1 Tax=Stegodyphus dumicola TaxID=202533 RepID=UPI0015A93048|nr:replication stress response regulator SDE2-like [Stegodyphus dumicola]